MKLIRAYATDFMAFEKIDIDFSKITGLNMIEGWNYDDDSASGAGKTQLMDLIAWVPFGESPRNIKAAEFINDNTSKGCVGGLEFLTDKGQVLKIERSRKPEDLHYTLDDGEPVRGGNVRETQTLIEELLQLDFNTFTNSVYFTQNSKMNFISASDTEKRDILTRILDLSDYDKAYDLTDLKIKEVNGGRDAIVTAIDKLTVVKAAYERDIAGLQAKSDAFDADKADELINKGMQVSSINGKIRDAKTLIETLTTKTFTPPPFEQSPPDLSKFEKEQEAVRNTKFDEVEADPEKPNNSDLDEQATKLIEKISAKSKVEAKLREVEKSSTELKYEFESNVKKMNKIDKTGRGQCPECLQDVDANHLAREHEVIANKNIELHTQIGSLNTQIGKLQDALEKIRQFERDLAKIEVDKNARERAYSAKIRELGAKRTEINNMKLAMERKILQIEQSKDAALREYAMAEKLYLEKVKTMDMEKADNANRIQSQHTAIEGFNEQLAQLAKDVIAIKAKPNVILSSIKDKEQDIEIKKVEIHNQEQKLKKLDDEIEVLTILKASYKNVKYYIFESTIDELNGRIDKYLEPLFNEDLKIRFEYVSGKNSDKMKFDTKIIKNSIVKTYESLSDGEKGRAKLATNFALSDIVSLRKASSFSLMLLDEVLNGLPEECRERVVELLEMLKNEKDTILIIDHFKAVGQLVEKTIRVEKHNGVSKVIDE